MITNAHASISPANPWKKAFDKTRDNTSQNRWSKRTAAQPARRTAKRTLRGRCLKSLKRNDKTKTAIIHGNICLANSRKDSEEKNSSIRQIFRMKDENVSIGVPPSHATVDLI